MAEPVCDQRVEDALSTVKAATDDEVDAMITPISCLHCGDELKRGQWASCYRVARVFQLVRGSFRGMAIVDSDEELDFDSIDIDDESAFMFHCKACNRPSPAVPPGAVAHRALPPAPDISAEFLDKAVHIEKVLEALTRAGFSEDTVQVSDLRVGDVILLESNMGMASISSVHPDATLPGYSMIRTVLILPSASALAPSARAAYSVVRRFDSSQRVWRAPPLPDIDPDVVDMIRGWSTAKPVVRRWIESDLKARFDDEAVDCFIAALNAGGPPPWSFLPKVPGSPRAGLDL